VLADGVHPGVRHRNAVGHKLGEFAYRTFRHSGDRKGKVEGGSAAAAGSEVAMEARDPASSRITAQRRVSSSMIRGKTVSPRWASWSTRRSEQRARSPRPCAPRREREHGQRVDVDALYVKRAWVDEGPRRSASSARAWPGNPVFKRSVTSPSWSTSAARRGGLIVGQRSSEGLPPGNH
jgi:hypothetical protein